MNPSTDKKIKLFVSHTSPYESIAKRLGAALNDLDPDRRLDVKISENIDPGDVWLRWIEDHTQTADGFILLYPHVDMLMNWPLYEVARFFGARQGPLSADGPDIRKIVCIKNANIGEFNKLFDHYQALKATPAGFLQFFRQVFVDGIFSHRKPLNPALGAHGHDGHFRDVAQQAADELAALFSEAAIVTHYHERRVVVRMHYGDDGQLAREKCLVEGNDEGLKMLRMAAGAATNWARVLSKLSDPPFAWVAELDRALEHFAADDIPPSLSPFQMDGDVYIPVVSRHKTVHDRLYLITVIFVKPDVQKLTRALELKVSNSIPETPAMLVKIFRLTLRARYEVLTAGRNELFRQPTPAHCLKIAQDVLAEFQALREDAKQAGIGGFAEFTGFFDPGLHAEMREARDDYVRAMKELASVADDSGEPPPPDTERSDQIDQLLVRLIQNNSRWLRLAARQFGLEFP